MGVVVKRVMEKKIKYFWLRGAGVALLSAFFLCSVPAQASLSVDQLYETSLLALDQGDSERQKSLREGLLQVIVRISGQTDFQDNVVIREALANPDTYLQQFGYVSLSDTEKADLRAATDTKNRLDSKTRSAKKLPPSMPPTIRIKLRFARESINSLLRKAQLPIWPANRPSVLAWVVIDGVGVGGKRLLNPSDPAQGFLLREASRRGLPVVLPMNDLKDQVGLGADRLWNLDQVAIAEASQRYGEDSILVGRVTQVAAGQWQGSWLYVLKGQSWLRESSADDLEALLAQGVNEAIKIQVERYGIRPDSSANSVLLAISGVNSVRDYATTVTFLKNLEAVKSLRITEVKADVVHCAIEIEGDSQMLRELIVLGSVLVAEDESIGGQATDVTPPATLHYRFSAE